MTTSCERKAHLGCGAVWIPGFINIDIHRYDHVDVVADIRDLEDFDTSSVDLVYACHVLEHFGRHEVSHVLSEWHRVLRQGGTLRLAVPDFGAVCERYMQTGKLGELLGLVCGGQTDDYDFHKMIFDFVSLKELLETVGFVSVKKYDWRDTEHSDIDDYSQAYLPHMAKDTGRLMSLNVEAVKV